MKFKMYLGLLIHFAAYMVIADIHGVVTAGCIVTMQIGYKWGWTQFMKEKNDAA